MENTIGFKTQKVCASYKQEICKIFRIEPASENNQFKDTKTWISNS